MCCRDLEAMPERASGSNERALGAKTTTAWKCRANLRTELSYGRGAQKAKKAEWQ